MTLEMPKYVLITPAHNESENIGRLADSVVSQTFLPQMWVIVDDGSIDNTSTIIKAYSSRHDWIKLVCIPEHHDRNFASKVYSFRKGYDRIKDQAFDIIGNIDADVSFAPDYLEYLISKFSENQKLGVAGTAFIENHRVAYDYDFTNIEHVSGQCQLFRRACFDEIGGYQPIKGGGIDWAAVTTARMLGWQTRTFLEKTFTHHRKMGSAVGNSPLIHFRQGKKDFFLGNHPLWEISRSLYQMTKKPWIFGGSLLFLGYVWAWLTGTEIAISDQLKQFIRNEQIQRLKRFARL